MKRLGLTLVAALCLAASTFAAGNQPTTAKWEGNINVNKLGKYLQLNSVQRLMRKTLSAEQYAKYAALMNLTLLNKGIDLSK